MAERLNEEQLKDMATQALQRSQATKLIDDRVALDLLQANFNDNTSWLAPQPLLDRWVEEARNAVEQAEFNSVVARYRLKARLIATGEMEPVVELPSGEEVRFEINKTILKGGD